MTIQPRRQCRLLPGTSASQTPGTHLHFGRPSGADDRAVRDYCWVAGGQPVFGV